MWKGLFQLSYLEKIRYKSAQSNDGQGSSSDPLSPSTTLQNIPAFPIVPETPGGPNSLSSYLRDLHDYYGKASNQNDNILDLAKHNIKAVLWKSRGYTGFETLKEYFNMLTEEEKANYNQEFIKIIDECLNNYKKEDSTSTPGPRPQDPQNLQPPDFFPPPTDAIPTLFPSNPRKLEFPGGYDGSDADNDSGSSDMNDESDSSSMDSDAVLGTPRH